MFSPAQLWLEIGAVATVILLIPIYMGIIHIGIAGVFVYAVVGGCAISMADALHFGLRDWHPDAWDFGLPAAAILGVGGIGYVLAVLLI
jgi:hypothetical protein